MVAVFLVLVMVDHGGSVLVSPQFTQKKLAVYHPTVGGLLNGSTIDKLLRNQQQSEKNHLQ